MFVIFPWSFIFLFRCFRFISEIVNGIGFENRDIVSNKDIPKRKIKSVNRVKVFDLFMFL